MGCESDIHYDESEGQDGDEGEVEVQDALSRARPTDSGIYCEYCDRCLNGPTQYEDHKRGKKHRKNYRASQGKQRSASEKTGIPKPIAPVVAPQRVEHSVDATGAAFQWGPTSPPHEAYGNPGYQWM